ncbi:MAG: DUF1722 domain-containing protein [Calditrichaeota bacterium]|nr:MAG: DUF1722 domain-containing protein [Calditrichota bacterium]
MKKEQPIFVGVSSCLLGAKVRFDAGHKKSDFVTDIMSDYVKFVSVCPEIEIGMGTPREAVRLVGSNENPEMLGVKSGISWTTKMNSYSNTRIKNADMKKLSGYILKSKSPSCGMERVKVYTEKGMPSHSGSGLFAKKLMDAYPYLPIEEEGRLQDKKIRENFIIRLFAYNRLKQLLKEPFSRKKIIQFHTEHKYLLMSHSVKHYKLIGQLVAKISEYKPAAFKKEYRQLFMDALKYQATAKKHTNVLMHILGYLKNNLTADEKSAILESIEDYRLRFIPLIVPVTLLKHYIYKYDVTYIKNQVYLEPHPKELMLRNHV